MMPVLTGFSPTPQSATKAALLSRKNLGLLLGLLGVTIFAATLPMTRLAVGELGPWFLTSGRAAVAGLIAVAVMVVLRRPWPGSEQLWRIALAAVLLVGGFPGFSGLAMQSVPAAHAGVVIGILPIATVIAATRISGERPSLAFWAWSMGGAGLVVAFVLRQGAGLPSSGDGLLLAAVVSAAFGYAISGQLSKQMPGWEVISWAVIVALPVTLPAALWLAPGHPALISATSWGAFAYLSIMSMYLGFFAWNSGLALGGVAHVAQVQLLQPFITISFAALLLGEKLEAEMLVFALGIVAVVFVSRKLKVT